jgi:hypothetical protein
MPYASLDDCYVACQAQLSPLVGVSWRQDGECYCDSDLYSFFAVATSNAMVETDYDLCPTSTSSSSSSVSATTSPTPTSTACCPNGVFTGDISEACVLTPGYGDGQCFGQYQINCFDAYLTEENTTNEFVALDPITWDQCLQFCLASGNVGGPWQGFDVLTTFVPGYTVWECTCLVGPSDYQYLMAPGQPSYGISGIECPTGPPTISFPCCEPFTGDLTDACVDPNIPNYGDGQCIGNTNTYQVSSKFL